MNQRDKSETDPTNEVERLRDLCAQMYQFAGAVGAPVRVLDQLAAAADGKPLPHETILPVSAEECDLIRDKGWL